MLNKMSNRINAGEYVSKSTAEKGQYTPIPRVRKRARIRHLHSMLLRFKQGAKRPRRASSAEVIIRFDERCG